MTSERRLRVKTLVMVLAMVVCANAGDLMLKRGMSQIGAVQLTASGLAQAFRLTVASGTIWVAIFFSERVHAELHDGAELGGLTAT